MLGFKEYVSYIYDIIIINHIMTQEKQTKRIWSTNELIIAYYIAKYDYLKLKITEYDFAEHIIGNTSVQSLRMQVANFRYLLGIEGYQLEHSSKLMKTIVDDLAHKTDVEIRRMINDYVSTIDTSSQIKTKKDINKAANKRRDELNAQYEKNFQNKLATLGRYRNLRKK